MQKNSITSKITPCCSLPFSVMYWFIQNLTLNAQSDREFIMSKLNQNGTISKEGWIVLINSATLETDSAMTKVQFLEMINCKGQPNCNELKLLIEGLKIGNWDDFKNSIEELNEAWLELENKLKLKYNNDSETEAVDIIQRVDKFTGEDVNYREVTNWYDGSLMDDTKTDVAIYLKRGSKYYKRQFDGRLNARWFGLKGDGSNETNTFILVLTMAKLLNVEIWLPKSNESYFYDRQIGVHTSIFSDGAKIKTQNAGGFAIRASNVVLDGIEFVNDRSITPTTVIQIITATTNDSERINNLTISNCKIGSGRIKLTNNTTERTSKFTFRNNELEVDFTGISTVGQLDFLAVEGCENIFIEGNRGILTSTNRGFFFHESTGGFITNCRNIIFSGNILQGIGKEDEDPYENSGQFINFNDKTTQVIVSNNIITVTGYHYIVSDKGFGFDSYGVRNYLIQGNLFTTNATALFFRGSFSRIDRDEFNRDYGTVKSINNTYNIEGKTINTDAIKFANLDNVVSVGDMMVFKFKDEAISVDGWSITNCDNVSVDDSTLVDCNIVVNYISTAIVTSSPMSSLIRLSNIFVLEKRKSVASSIAIRGELGKPVPVSRISIKEIHFQAKQEGTTPLPFSIRYLNVDSFTMSGISCSRSLGALFSEVDLTIRRRVQYDLYNEKVTGLIPDATAVAKGLVNKTPTQANSVATDVPTLASDFNALLSKLKTAGIVS